EVEGDHIQQKGQPQHYQGDAIVRATARGRDTRLLDGAKLFGCLSRGGVHRLFLSVRSVAPSCVQGASISMSQKYFSDTKVIAHGETVVKGCSERLAEGERWSALLYC